MPASSSPVPADKAEYLSAPGEIRGGLGNDRLEYLLGGIFYGGAGADDAWWVEGGKFKAGPGADDVRWMSGGVFNGARGNDAVDRNNANLGWYMVTATFHGGPGIDYAEICGDGNTLTNVEHKVSVPC